MPVLVGVFVTWFVLESVFFADSDMPFLRARQMMSFPCGVLLAKHKEKIEEALTKTKSVLILMGGYTVPFLHGSNTATYGQGTAVFSL